MSETNFIRINRPSFGYAAALLLTLLISGCAHPEAKRPPEGYADYTNGVLSTYYAADVLKMYDASVKALHDLGMTIRNSGKDGTGGYIEATRPDDMAVVWITFKTQGRNDTAAAIKVGTAGDEAYSRVIADTIAARVNG